MRALPELPPCNARQQEDGRGQAREQIELPSGATRRPLAVTAARSTFPRVLSVVAVDLVRGPVACADRHSVSKGIK